MVSPRKFGRLALVENVVALIVLAVVACLAYPIVTAAKTNPKNHCGCPASARNCEMPCDQCCDDPGTPELEKCPCQENPTHDH